MLVVVVISLLQNFSCVHYQFAKLKFEIQENSPFLCPHFGERIWHMLKKLKMMIYITLCQTMHGKCIFFVFCATCDITNRTTLQDTINIILLVYLSVSIQFACRTTWFQSFTVIFAASKNITINALHANIQWNLACYLLNQVVVKLISVWFDNVLRMPTFVMLSGKPVDVQHFSTVWVIT